MYMSYCRFEGANAELDACESALEEFVNGDCNSITSERERQEAKRLISLCRYITENYTEEDIDRMADHYDREEREAEDDD